MATGKPLQQRDRFEVRDQFGTPAEFTAYVAADLAKWARLAQEAGLKLE